LLYIFRAKELLEKKRTEKEQKEFEVIGFLLYIVSSNIQKNRWSYSSQLFSSSIH